MTLTTKPFFSTWVEDSGGIGQDLQPIVDDDIYRWYALNGQCLAVATEIADFLELPTIAVAWMGSINDSTLIHCFAKSDTDLLYLKSARVLHPSGWR